jgi:hypothetical protein
VTTQADANGTVTVNLGTVPSGQVYTGSIQPVASNIPGTQQGIWEVLIDGFPAAAWQSAGLVSDFQALDGQEVVLSGTHLNVGQPITVYWRGYISPSDLAPYAQPKIYTSPIDTIFLRGIDITNGAIITGAPQIGPSTSEALIAAPTGQWYLWSLAIQVTAIDTTTTGGSGGHQFVASIQRSDTSAVLMTCTVLTPGVSGTGAVAPTAENSINCWGVPFPAGVGLNLVTGAYNGNTGLATANAVYAF